MSVAAPTNCHLPVPPGRRTVGDDALYLDARPLLRCAGVANKTAHRELAIKMSLTTPTASRCVSWWAAGRPVTKAEHVVGLIVALGLSRCDVLATTPHLPLLRVLWSPVLGNLLRTARQAQGLTVHQVANRSGTAIATLVRWEDGSTTPNSARLIGAMRTVGLSSNELLLAAAWPDNAEARMGSRSQGRGFPDALRTARVNGGWSQRRLANRCGVSQPLVSQWETGRTFPRPSTWPAVCSALAELERPTTASEMREWRPRAQEQGSA